MDGAADAARPVEPEEDGEVQREVGEGVDADATARGDYYRSGGWAGYDESGDDTWDESRIAADRDAARNYRPTTRM